MRPRKSNFWLYTFALTIALAFHAYLWNQMIPEGLSGFAQKPKENNPEIVIDKIPMNPEDEKKPIVQTSKAPEDESLKDKKARFGGEFKNRVAKEMQAPNQGKFRQGGPPIGGDTSPRDEKGEAAGPQMRELMPFASSPEGLPNDIPKGPQTMLNTDPVMYASFYNRIKDLIYDPWVAYANDAARDFFSKHHLQEDLYITRLEVEMNRAGDITGITILKRCGVEGLDRAPEKAFWEVKNFPNPPKQIFDKDGFLRFQYEFHYQLGGNFFGIQPLNI